MYDKFVTLLKHICKGAIMLRGLAACIIDFPIDIIFFCWNSQLTVHQVKFVI
jgi:hypothetical protein